MKRSLLFLAGMLCLISQSATAQMADPVSWKFTSQRIQGDTVLIELTATIQPFWKMYALQLPKGGPSPTKISFPAGGYTPAGKISDTPQPRQHFDAIFQMTIGYYTGTVRFAQKMIPSGKAQSSTIKGSVEYMCCDDKSCVAQSKDFSIAVAASGTEETQSAKRDEPSSILPIQGFKSGISRTQKPEPETPSTPQPRTSGTVSETSLWSFFFLCILGGFAGVLTPCVFPMIPMTVSYFLRDKQQKGKGMASGLFFALSIVVIYTAIGLIVSLTNAGPSIGQTLSTHWIPNLLFFALFVVFGLSMLGTFELMLPGSWSDKMDRLGERGGLAGIFFMALTLVIVSFSCTGPIVGAILVESAGSVTTKPLVGMLGFSIAFALPFGLLALFPSWLTKMPKSGGWMNILKGTLGFLLLAFSTKYLTNIDQTYGLNLLPRTVILILWIALLLMLGFFLSGKLPLKHTPREEHPGIIRTLAAAICFALGVFLSFGITRQSLPFFESMLPPLHTQQSPKQTSALCATPRWADRLYLPHGLQAYFDYEEGLACAKKQNKPILLLFTGHACANCKKMEASVWIDPEVYKVLSKDILIIALFTDDHTTLPEQEWITSSYDGKLKKTMGQKNADLQITRFASNTQPYYIILNPQGIPVLPAMGYTSSTTEFQQFLQSGIARSRSTSVAQ